MGLNALMWSVYIFTRYPTVQGLAILHHSVRGKVWGALGDELAYKGLGSVAQAQGALGEVGDYV